MKKNLFAFLMLLSSIPVWSQNDKVNLFLKFHPLNFFSSARPYIQGSAELIINEHLGIELDYGRRYGYAGVLDSKPDSMTFGRNGRNILVELYFRKAFLKVEGKRWGLYDFWGITYRNVHDQRNLQLGYRDSTQTEKKQDYYGLETIKDAWALRWGIEATYKRMVLEAFVEIGVQNMSKFEVGFDETKDHDHVYGFTAKDTYDGYQVNLNAGIKVGLRIF